MNEETINKVERAKRLLDELYTISKSVEDKEKEEIENYIDKLEQK